MTVRAAVVRGLVVACGCALAGCSAVTGFADLVFDGRDMGEGERRDASGSDEDANVEDGGLPADAGAEAGLDAGDSARPGDAGDAGDSGDAEADRRDAGDAEADGGRLCSSPLDCANADECDGTERCVDGFCAPALAPLACPDLDPGPCIDFVCVTGEGCVPRTLPGTPCDDGDPCRDPDSCDTMGVCGGIPIVCMPGYTCTGGACICPGRVCGGTCQPTFDCCPTEIGGTCGMCGTQSCNGSGHWDCVDQDECSPGSGRLLDNCGDTGLRCSQSCNPDCHWGGCFACM